MYNSSSQNAIKEGYVISGAAQKGDFIAMKLGLISVKVNTIYIIYLYFLTNYY